MKGALVVLLRRPSQLKPSNHLCFWISLIPPRPNPNRSEGFSLKQINVKHCLFSKCFFIVFFQYRDDLFIFYVVGFILFVRFFRHVISRQECDFKLCYTTKRYFYVY